MNKNSTQCLGNNQIIIFYLPAFFFLEAPPRSFILVVAYDYFS